MTNDKYQEALDWLELFFRDPPSPPHIKTIRAALQAQRDGLVSVPIEPTTGFPSMSQAGAAQMWEETKALGCACGGHEQAARIYKAMIAAAPKEGV